MRCQIYFLRRYVLKCNKLEKRWINFKQKLYTWTVHKSRKSCKWNLFWMRFYGHIKFESVKILQFSFVLVNCFFWKDTKLTIAFWCYLRFWGNNAFGGASKPKVPPKAEKLSREKQVNKHNKKSIMWINIISSPSICIMIGSSIWKDYKRNGTVCVRAVAKFIIVLSSR